MTEACQAPNACPSNSLPVSGGMFSYDCPYLPPSTRFGLTAYAIILNPTTPNNTSYQIVSEDGEIATFTNTNLQPYKFLSTTAGNGYTSAKVQNGDVLTLVKDNVRWVIGINVRFTSCLITEGYKNCSSPDKPPTAEGPGSTTPIPFTFPCPLLPQASAFGFSTYNLQLIYLGAREYNVYLKPNGALDFVRVGAFTYQDGFSQAVTENNYI